MNSQPPKPMNFKRKLSLIRHALNANALKTLTAHRNTAPPGMQFEETQHCDGYTVRHTIEDGIERVEFQPDAPRFNTPLFFHHGMWHGAWVWDSWQALFAQWGWQSVASSLPGHGGSLVQRPVDECTLDYYLGFVRDEVQRLPQRPVYLGHSMGGALGQWYLRYIGDDLPAMVMLAAWTHQNAWLDSLPLFLRLGLKPVFEIYQQGNAWPWVSTPERAGRLLLGPNATWTAEQLHQRLGSESTLVMLQQNPPTWHPPKSIRTPMLWLAAEKDAVISASAAHRSARYYGADFMLVSGSGHNFMMDSSSEDTARKVHDWLASRVA